MFVRIFQAAAILIASVLIQPSATQAATPEETYLAARDAFVAKLKQSDPADDRTQKEEENARRDLEQQMRRIVGPTNISGVGPEGRLTIETLLADDIGFGTLDGLLFEAADNKLHVLVTTEGLVSAWLKAHKDWSGRPPEMPQDIAAAFKADAFYTQAISPDAAVSTYAEIPVIKPAGATAVVALLVARAQDIGPQIPDEVLLSVHQGGRVYVVSASAAAPTAAIPACDEVWRKSEQNAQRALDAYNASDSKDEALFERYTAIQEEGDAAFRRCYAEKAKGQPFFAALTRQAQDIANALPPR